MIDPASAQNGLFGLLGWFSSPRAEGQTSSDPDVWRDLLADASSADLPSPESELVPPSEIEPGSQAAQAGPLPVPTVTEAELLPVAVSESELQPAIEVEAVAVPAREGDTPAERLIRYAEGLRQSMVAAIQHAREQPVPATPASPADPTEALPVTDTEDGTASVRSPELDLPLDPRARFREAVAQRSATPSSPEPATPDAGAPSQSGVPTTPTTPTPAPEIVSTDSRSEPQRPFVPPSQRDLPESPDLPDRERADASGTRRPDVRPRPVLDGELQRSRLTHDREHVGESEADEPDRVETRDRSRQPQHPDRPVDRPIPGRVGPRPDAARADRPESVVLERDEPDRPRLQPSLRQSPLLPEVARRDLPELSSDDRRSLRDDAVPIDRDAIEAGDEPRFERPPDSLPRAAREIREIRNAGDAENAGDPPVARPPSETRPETRGPADVVAPTTVVDPRSTGLTREPSRNDGRDSDDRQPGRPSEAIDDVRRTRRPVARAYESQSSPERQQSESARPRVIRNDDPTAADTRVRIDEALREELTRALRDARTSDSRPNETPTAPAATTTAPLRTTTLAAPQVTSSMTAGTTATAPVESAPATPETSTIPRVQHTQLAEAIVARARNVPDNGTLEIRFALEPRDLGWVRVRIESRGDEMKIRLVTATGAAADALQSGLGRLVAHLSEAGVRNPQVEIGMDDGSQHNQAQQQEGGPERRHSRARASAAAGRGPAMTRAQPSRDDSTDRSHLDRTA